MKCKYCGKVIKNCYNSQKYHPKCFKQNRKKYYQRPEVKQKVKEYYQRPEVKQKAKEYKKKYYQRPEVKQMKRKRDRKTYALKKEFKKKILLKILEKYKK